MKTIDKLKRLRDELDTMSNEDHYTLSDAIKRLDAIIEAEGYGWISVDERLPENNDKGNQMMRVIISNPFGSQEAYFNPVLKIFLTLGYSKIKNVTHWMPLPQSPKQS